MSVDPPLPTMKTFFLIEPIDMYHKLWWETTKARNSQGSSPRETAYAALNAATTGWHLAEWIAHRLTPLQFENLRQAGHPVHGKKSMQEYAKTTRPMAMIEQIANAAKHYRIGKRPVEVTTFDTWLDPGEGREHIWVPMVKDGSLNVPLSVALGFVLSFWRTIFLDSQLATVDQLDSRLPELRRQTDSSEQRAPRQNIEDHLDGSSKQPFEHLEIDMAMCGKCLNIETGKRHAEGHDSLSKLSASNQNWGQGTIITTKYRCKDCGTKWEYEDDKNDSFAGWSLDV